MILLIVGELFALPFAVCLLDSVLSEPSNLEGSFFIIMISLILIFTPILFCLLYDSDASSTTSRSHGDAMDSSDVLSGQAQETGWFQDKESKDDELRREVYAKQDEDLAILEDMIQMHATNPDADLESHYGWEYKMDYDQDGDEDYEKDNEW